MLLSALTVLLAFTSWAPTALSVEDTPHDGGSSLTVRWRALASAPGVDSVEALTLVRIGPDGTALQRAVLTPGDSLFVDEGLKRNALYTYELRATVGGGEVVLATGSGVPRLQVFRTDRTAVAVATVVFTGLLLWFTSHARAGRRLYVRKIAGLEAVEEAVGRATEMGKPIMYIPGISGMDDVATIASMQILAQVARSAGTYGARLIVPNRDPIVMAVAQEVVREAYNEIGRPDLYREDDIYYVTFSQFGYAAAVSGIMLRERPATNFFLGMFYAESLILSETGVTTGALQIAGTDSDAQLPFFITSCDYTLIGEELYAASVYLSREPMLLGSLKAQDWAKAMVVALTLVGAALSLAGLPGFAKVFR